MELVDRLRILTEGARYDASCVSSGSRRKKAGGSLGICHSWTEDGRCVSLLKILQTNDCIFNCRYCVHRTDRDGPRTFLSAREIADLTVNFYRRNYIEGLFLSSAVRGSPAQAMETMLASAKILRKEYKFPGYIHLKGIPGADESLLKKAGYFADRMSVNIELPSAESLKKLAPQKKPADIFNPMHFLEKNRREEKGFLGAGQSTQLIIGASPESDREIISLASYLYGKFSLSRIFYSAYIPTGDPRYIPGVLNPPLLREHRLYQADWLFRFYHFSFDDIIPPGQNDLETELDPKSAWALRNFWFFPVEVNRASYRELLKIPGIGPVSAHRIIKARKERTLDYSHLKKLGIVMKRACFFVTCGGRRIPGLPSDPDHIRPFLTMPVSRPRQPRLLAPPGGERF